MAKKNHTLKTQPPSPFLRPFPFGRGPPPTIGADLGNELGRPPVRPAPDGVESCTTSTARLPLLGRGKNLKTQKKPGKDSGTPGSKGSWTGRGGDHRPPHPEPCQTVEKPYLANKNKDFYSKTPTPPFLGTLAAPLPLAPLPLSPPAPSRALPRTAQPTAPLTRRRWPRRRRMRNA